MCLCDRCEYHYIYNNGFQQKDKKKWIASWLDVLKKTNCRRCKCRILVNLKKAIETQSAFLSIQKYPLYSKLLNEYHKSMIAKQGAAKVLNKSITKHLYKPNGVMMRKSCEIVKNLY